MKINEAFYGDIVYDIYDVVRHRWEIKRLQSPRCHRSDLLALSYLFRDGVPPKVSRPGDEQRILGPKKGGRMEETYCIPPR